MDANGIETDVQETADSRLVLFHDKTIERITGLKGAIKDYTYEELLQMDFGIYKGEKYKKEPIVLFEEFLKCFSGKDLAFAIELKADGIEKNVLKAIEKYHCKNKVIVTSFSLLQLTNIRNFDKEIRLGFLTSDSGKELIDDLSIKGIMQYCPKVTVLDADIIAYARQKGLSIRAWGIADENDMRAALSHDIDGMTINFPDKLAGEIRKTLND